MCTFSISRPINFFAGQFTKDEWYGIYKIVLLFWIMFGLGYLVMILGFISRAMRSKKMAKLERTLTKNLKQTHSKILNEFSRDVTYARRLLSELYLLKFKVRMIFSHIHIGIGILKLFFFFFFILVPTCRIV